MPVKYKPSRGKVSFHYDQKMNSYLGWCRTCRVDAGRIDKAGPEWVARRANGNFIVAHQDAEDGGWWSAMLAVVDIHLATANCVASQSQATSSKAVNRPVAHLFPPELVEGGG